MRYLCVDPVEFLYPDMKEYKSATDEINILTPRGSYACAQIFLTEGNGSVSVECKGWEPEIYEMVAVPVEETYWREEDTMVPHAPERMAPFDVYDCLKPYGGEIVFQNGVAAVYFSMWIPKDAPVGILKGFVQIGEISIPVTIEVSAAVVPEESLTVLMFYDAGNVMKFHKVEAGSAEFDRFETEYLRMMRRMRQNGISVSGGRKIALGDNKYAFDFSQLKTQISKMSALGFNKFYMQLGYRESWFKPTILVSGMPSMSFEAYCYMSQYLPALSDFLTEHGWIDKFMLSVSDEPNEANAMEFKALCNLIRKFAPKIRLCDAIPSGVVDGSLDIAIPISSSYEENRDAYEAYRSSGDEIWYYDCCGPRDKGYINRFMDYPLLSTRYHAWGNYAYNLTGYLHWAVNGYQPGQDPFVQNVPSHKNADSVHPLPPGDTHIVYPGEDGPWMSVRLENQRAGAEEYEMFRAVASYDKELADSICGTVFHSFKDVEYDPLVFRATRNKLIRAMEKNG